MSEPEAPPEFFEDGTVYLLTWGGVGLLGLYRRFGDAVEAARRHAERDGSDPPREWTAHVGQYFSSGVYGIQLRHIMRLREEV